MLASCSLLKAQGDTDSLYYSLLNQNRMSLQEKIYLHLDNTCYYPGDTIWYKAYLLRADNLAPSPLSKMLYVELITPEGYVVERQRVLCSPGASSCGQFAINDTIYSGYYELRAYTKWQLNFNVGERKYSKFNAQKFFNKQLAADYFREYEDLYSRVIPIYEKPAKAGDYSLKRIIKRQKRRLDKDVSELHVSFFPEGGQIVKGLPCRIAFEATDAYGKPLDISGKLTDGTELKTLADGRGTFILNNANNKPQASFSFEGKEYKFDLPKPLPAGITLSFDAENHSVEVAAQGVEVGPMSVMCRGQLVDFFTKAQSTTLNWDKLPTGVNEITVYDTQMNPVAVRQIFVNHGDMQHSLDLQMQTQNMTMSAQASRQHTLKAYEPVNVHGQLSETGLKTVSIAIRDTRNEELTYDDGNILTDLLLAGDLRGFVAHPAYYFEADDSQHRERLDLLMMIQGWHKYTAISEFRYLPEVQFQVHGQVQKFGTYDKDEFDQRTWNTDQNEGNTNNSLLTTFTLDNVTGRIIPVNPQAELEAYLPKGLVGNGGDDQTAETETDESSDGETSISDSSTDDAPTPEHIQNEYRDHKKTTFKQPLYVEAELEKDGQVAGVVVETDLDGHFTFNLPPFYEYGYLFMTAYTKRDSAKMCLTSTSDKYRMDGYACPDFYLRQEKFFPVFTKPYSWFQTHQPSQNTDTSEDGVSALDSLLADHVLDGVTVQTKRRRGVRSFDKNKALLERDFNDLYNDLIDYGLHRGGYNPSRVWDEASRFLFGNMGKPNEVIGIRVQIEGHTFLKTYAADQFESWGVPMTLARLNTITSPARIWKTHIFTDYDLRNDDGKDENRSLPDAVFELIPVPNAGVLPFRRDRRMRYMGFTYAEEFYNPDYSNSTPEEPTDYRRTLYWNPNAKVAADGTIDITFFTGSRDCRVQVDACGVNDKGEIYSEIKPFTKQ